MKKSFALYMLLQIIYLLNGFFIQSLNVRLAKDMLVLNVAGHNVQTRKTFYGENFWIAHIVKQIPVDINLNKSEPGWIAGGKAEYHDSIDDIYKRMNEKLRDLPLHWSEDQNG